LRKARDKSGAENVHPAQQDDDLGFRRRDRIQQTRVVRLARLFAAAPYDRTRRDPKPAGPLQGEGARAIDHQSRNFERDVAGPRTLHERFEIAAVPRRENRRAPLLFTAPQIDRFDDARSRFAPVIFDQPLTGHERNQRLPIAAFAERKKRRAQQRHAEAALARAFDETKRPEDADPRLLPPMPQPEKSQTARIERGEAEPAGAIFGDPRPARRGLARPRSAELGVDPGQERLGRALIANGTDTARIERFECAMHRVPSETRLAEIGEQVDDAHARPPLRRCAPGG